MWEWAQHSALGRTRWCSPCWRHCPPRCGLLADCNKWHCHPSLAWRSITHHPRGGGCTAGRIFSHGIAKGEMKRTENVLEAAPPSRLWGTPKGFFDSPSLRQRGAEEAPCCMWGPLPLSIWELGKKAHGQMFSDEKRKINKREYLTLHH